VLPSIKLNTSIIKNSFTISKYYSHRGGGTGRIDFYMSKLLAI